VFSTYEIEKYFYFYLVSTRYKFWERYASYFVTFAVVDWVDVSPLLVFFPSGASLFRRCWCSSPTTVAGYAGADLCSFYSVVFC